MILIAAAALAPRVEIAGVEDLAKFEKIPDETGGIVEVYVPGRCESAFQGKELEHFCAKAVGAVKSHFQKSMVLYAKGAT